MLVVMMYDIIVFKNLCFHPFTRKREAGIFKNLHYGDRSWKIRIFGARLCVNGRLKCRKKTMFSKHQDMCGQGETDDQK